MSRGTKVILLDIGVFFSMLLDGQISSLLSNYLPNQFHVISHILLITIQFLSFLYSEQHLILLFAVVGFLYDVYYLHTVGIATLSLPVMAILLRRYNSILLGNRWAQCVTTAVMVLFFDCLSYFISNILQGTSLAFPLFVVYALAPTMLLNIVLSPILHRWFERISI